MSSGEIFIDSIKLDYLMLCLCFPKKLVVNLDNYFVLYMKMKEKSKKNKNYFKSFIVASFLFLEEYSIWLDI